MSLPTKCYYFDNNFKCISADSINTGWWIDNKSLAREILASILNKKEYFEKSEYLLFYSWLVPKKFIKSYNNAKEFEENLIKKLNEREFDKYDNELVKLSIDEFLSKSKWKIIDNLYSEYDKSYSIIILNVYPDGEVSRKIFKISDKEIMNKILENFKESYEGKWNEILDDYVEKIK